MKRLYIQQLNETDPLNQQEMKNGVKKCER
jgi:hypothetical protein